MGYRSARLNEWSVLATARPPPYLFVTPYHFTLFKWFGPAVSVGLDR